MNWELYNKYGAYNNDGYYIEDHKKWDYYAKLPKLYKRKKIYAALFLLIPICGIIFAGLIYEEMGLSLV
jgi:hypothetical protein